MPFFLIDVSEQREEGSYTIEEDSIFDGNERN